MKSLVRSSIKLLSRIYKYKKISIPIIGVIAILTVFTFFKGEESQIEKLDKEKDQRVQAPVVKARQEINQIFYFLIGSNKIGYTLENAELQDEIIVKGQIAKSVKGKTFLVVNLKIRNDTNNVVEVNTRDYIRLTINGNKEDKLALEIHNDPVLVQPISTKSTRLGSPIKDSDKNLVLLVGEIQGEKKNIAINFK